MPIPAEEDTDPIPILYLGPFAIDGMLKARAERCGRVLEDTYGVRVKMSIAQPPFNIDDIDCKGCHVIVHKRW